MIFTPIKNPTRFRWLMALAGQFAARKDSALAIAATFVRAGASLVVQKMVALTAGPSGVAILSHFQNLIGILTAIPSDGINRAMVVEAGPKEGPDRRAVYGFGLIAVLLFGAVIYLLSPWLTFFSPELFPATSAQSNAKWLGIGAVAFSLIAWMMTVLQSRAMLWRALLGQAAASVAGILVLAGTRIHHWPFVFSLALWLVGQSLVGLLFLPCRHIAFRLKPPPGFFKVIGNFIVLAVGIALAGRTADFAVREFALQHYSRTSIGVWQAALRLADLAYIPFQAVVGGVLFPRAAALSGKPLAEYGKRHTLWAFAFLLAVHGVLWLGSGIVIPLLNSRAFVDGQLYYQIVAPGEVARGFGLIPVYMLKARGRTYAVLSLELLSLSAYLLLLFLLQPRLGLQGVVLAGSIRYWIWALAALVVERRVASQEQG